MSVFLSDFGLKVSQCISQIVFTFPFNKAKTVSVFFNSSDEVWRSWCHCWSRICKLGPAFILYSNPIKQKQNPPLFLPNSQLSHLPILFFLNSTSELLTSPQLYLNFPTVSWADPPDHPVSALTHGFILHNCNGLCEMTWVEWGWSARLSWPKCFSFSFVFYVCVPWTVSLLLRRISWIFLKRIKVKKYIV